MQKDEEMDLSWREVKTITISCSFKQPPSSLAQEVVLFKITAIPCMHDGETLRVFKIVVPYFLCEKELPSLSIQLIICTRSATKLGISHFISAELPMMTYSFPTSVSYSWFTAEKTFKNCFVKLCRKIAYNIFAWLCNGRISWLIHFLHHIPVARVDFE